MTMEMTTGMTTGMETGMTTGMTELLMAQKYNNVRPTSLRILRVGPDKEYDTVQKAVIAAAAGDQIIVDEGTYNFAGNEYRSRYNPDAPCKIGINLSIIGLGNVIFETGDVTKGALVTVEGCNYFYVENITFQNAHNRDFNGAGIRHQAGDLKVVNCVFDNNQNGILGGADEFNINLIDSVFSNNGAGDGRSHGVYFNKMVNTSLVVQNCHFFGTKIGHHIKTMTADTKIVSCVLDDTANASMAIDVTAGGKLLVENCHITQGPQADNPRIIYYSKDRGGELDSVLIQNNTFENKFTNCEVIGIGSLRHPVTLKNNIISDVSGKLILSNGLYNSFDNVLNGEALPNGDYRKLADVSTLIPVSLRDRIPVMPVELAVGPDGVYVVAGWGSHTLEGGAGNDVLHAVSKGTKTMIGGPGDDKYILEGQWTIVENPDEGYDWCIFNGGWAFQIPKGCEAVFVNPEGRTVNLSGNEEGNLIIGGGPGEKIDGKGGDDEIFGGPGMGDTIRGGTGFDTVMFAGKREEYEITEEGEYTLISKKNSNEGVTKVYHDVEKIVFDDVEYVRPGEEEPDEDDDEVVEEPDEEVVEPKNETTITIVVKSTGIVNVEVIEE